MAGGMFTGIVVAVLCNVADTNNCEEFIYAFSDTSPFVTEESQIEPVCGEFKSLVYDVVNANIVETLKEQNVRVNIKEMKCFFNVKSVPSDKLIEKMKGSKL